MTDNYTYDARAREAKVFEERMALTSFKAKALEWAIRAEGAADAQMGAYFSGIAQTYATLELARVTALSNKKK